MVANAICEDSAIEPIASQIRNTHLKESAANMIIRMNVNALSASDVRLQNEFTGRVSIGLK